MLEKETEVIHLKADCGEDRAIHWVFLRAEGIKEEDSLLGGNVEE